MMTDTTKNITLVETPICSYILDDIHGEWFIIRGADKTLINVSIDRHKIIARKCPVVITIEDTRNAGKSPSHCTCEEYVLRPAPPPYCYLVTDLLPELNTCSISRFII